VRGAEHVFHRRQDHDLGSQRAARQIAVGVFARCENRPALRSGLATRQVGGRQVRQVAKPGDRR
jgi:hypothetical protein